MDKIVKTLFALFLVGMRIKLGKSHVKKKGRSSIYLLVVKCWTSVMLKTASPRNIICPCLANKTLVTVHAIRSILYFWCTAMSALHWRFHMLKRRGKNLHGVGCGRLSLSFLTWTFNWFPLKVLLSLGLELRTYHDSCLKHISRADKTCKSDL